MNTRLSLSRAIKACCHCCFIALLCLLSFHLHAIENSGYLCQSGNQVRAIHIVYPNKTLVPCEVQYIKNGTLQVLWAAQNQTGYCERKASEFVEKQKDWGWTCSVRSLTSFVKPKTSLPHVTFTAIPAEE